MWLALPLGLLSSFSPQCYIHYLTGLTGQQSLAYVHKTMAFAVPGKCHLKTKNAPVVKTLVLLAVAEVSW